MVFNHYLGIDISKKTLDAALIIREGEVIGQTKVSNDATGFKELASWISQKKIKFSEVLVCAEHTGAYGYDLQFWLDKKQINYAFVSALEIQRSIGIRRGKNDAVDAIRIAEYAYLRRDTISLSHKPSDKILQLKVLLRERKQYVRTRAGLMARKDALEKYESKKCQHRRVAIIAKLTNDIACIDAQMQGIIEKEPDIKRNFNLIMSVTGVGLVNAVNTIVYTSNFTSFQTPRQYACYCGIAPFEHKSGTSVNGRTMVSGIGNHQLKCELTMAARSAIIHDPWIRQYFNRKMAEKGNAPGAYGVVLNAVKFKIVTRMFSVVKVGTPYKVMTYC